MVIEYKIIILEHNFENKNYNAILFCTKLEISKPYIINLIEEFTNSEIKIFEKTFNFDTKILNKDKIIIQDIFNYLKEKYNLTIKVDLFFEELVPFMIPNSNIEKLEKL